MSDTTPTDQPTPPTEAELAELETHYRELSKMVGILSLMDADQKIDSVRGVEDIDNLRLMVVIAANAIQPETGLMLMLTGRPR